MAAFFLITVFDITQYTFITETRGTDPMAHLTGVLFVQVALVTQFFF